MQIRIGIKSLGYLLRIMLTICVVTAVTSCNFCEAQSKQKNNPKTDKYTIPVGLDAYRYWDRWPMQRIGVRAYMRSTYDRAGGNNDMSNFLFMKEEDYNVTLDVAGKGVLYFFRSNFWHGSPWHFNVDTSDEIVSETATDDPVNARRDLKTSSFLPANAFPEPLAWTWGTTKGADLIWTPIPFENSFQLAYSRTSFGTGYYIYHIYANENNLSMPVKSWDIKASPDIDVVKLIERSGTDIAPQNISRKVGKVKFDNSRVTLATIKQNFPSVIRALKFTLPLAKAIDVERLKLIITWDGRKEPSVEAPLCLLFGAGTFYNRESKEYLVKGFPINVHFDYKAGQVEIACYYPMPFFNSAKFELEGNSNGLAEISYEIRYERSNLPKSSSSYFHATYKDIPTLEVGKDLVVLDTKEVENSDVWSGSFVGTSLVFSHNGALNSLEGDPRFFFDDSNSPQAYGTGTEEWSGGGFYWGGENMTLPFAGHPCGASSKETAKGEKDLIESSYRFLLADLMPFGKRARIQFEHGGENLSSDHYETVTYWYGAPSASLIKTDELDIGNIESEKIHAYSSPDGTEVQTITSRYELGIDTFPKLPWVIPGRKDTLKPANYDTLKGKEIFKATTLDGRTTNGIVEFSIKLRTDNQGVLLRRRLDYSIPNQKAEVFVAISGTNAWKFVGVWYLAGSNTSVFSFPRGELDLRSYSVRTSNRRFREDEFMIPMALSSNVSSLKIRIKPMNQTQELYPGMPYPNQTAWSELDYTVYSYVTPDF
ncbi:MAG: DUF2961 domain-containing protein [Chryseolinea sp.]